MRRGFTLIEVLVALALLALLVGFGLRSLVSGVQANNGLSASLSAEQKARRILQVFTQDLRSAAFGALSPTPYPTGRHSISFLLVDAAGGNVVLPHDSGRNASFRRADEFKYVPRNRVLAVRTGEEGLLVNATGEALLFVATQAGFVGGGRAKVTHSGCANAIDYTPNTLLFKVIRLGYRYDPKNATLYRNWGRGEAPVAYGIRRFDLDYVYVSSADNRIRTNLGSYDYDRPTGAPPTEVQLDGRTYRLKRLTLTLAVDAVSRNAKKTRTLSATVDLLRGTPQTIRTVYVCGGKP